MSAAATLTAIKLADAAMGFAIEYLLASQKYSQLVMNARTEGREVSEEELDQLTANADAATQRAIDLLQGTHSGPAPSGDPEAD